MQPDVVVIGGGVAGLTAAVDLSSNGFSVLLIEQKQHCGGRTYSFIHDTTGDEVDNGQHLIMGCYHSTLKFLSTIGARSRVSVQKNLSVAFCDSHGGTFRLQAASLPAPLNVLVGLLRLKSLSFTQRLSLLRVGGALLFANPDNDKKLQSMTVTQWLDSLHQAEENKRYLWDIIAIGTLNDSPAFVSAALFVKVLRSAFLGSRSDSSMVIPQQGLSKIFVDGAIDFLAKRNNRVLMNTAVEKLTVRDGVVTDVTLSSGKTVSPRAVISAVPYFDLARMFGSGFAQQFPEFHFIDQFTSSSIITIHLWFESSFIDEEFVALLDSPIHWVFNKSKIYKKNVNGLSYLSLVISGAADLIEHEKEDLTSMAVFELGRFFPESVGVKLVHSLVMKEKRATFSPRVGTDAFRPSHATSLRNFFLAGDWTDTKLPATIEGAVQSGYACSELAGKILEVRR